MRMTSRVCVTVGAGSTLLAALLAAPVSPAAAQGSLSMQGFGYPIGGQSARSQGSGSALAGIDPQTPLNPASIVLNGRLQAYGQYEPEFRTVTIGGNSTKTTTSRFPLFMVTGHQNKATVALSFSSLMDRTWINTYADTQSLGSERIASTVLTQSVGGIADARLAVAWTFTEYFHVGGAVHLYPGDNKVSVGRIFSDSVHAGNFDVTNAYTFAGSALSLGAVYVVAKAHLILSGDLRLGGQLAMRLGDSTKVGEGKIPFRAGMSASYDGIAGSVFSVRIGTERWSDLRGLGSSSLGLKDAVDMAIGTEIAGPRISNTPVLFRAGYRTRGLPFTYGATAVTESSIGGGIGVPFIGGRTILDVGASRATRNVPGISEKSWLVSVGIGIRP